MSLGGGGEIPKEGRAGRAKSLGIWPRGGGEVTRGRNPWDTGNGQNEIVSDTVRSEEKL